MGKSESVLITGGAGYIGSVLTRKLVNYGFRVKVLDSLIYGSEGVSEILSNNLVELIVEDIRNYEAFEDAVNDVGSVVHLAAIVGEPLCKKIPEAAKQINENATKKLVKISKKQGIRRFIFASTCSNYGSSLGVVDELTPVNSLSLYSKTKVNAESFVLNSKTPEFSTCVLRFATAFGRSPRMRFDLLVQEFIRDALIDNKIVIFGPNYWRPFVHVDDISNACLLALTSPTKLISGEIYNVGENNQNFKKIDLAKMIQKCVPSTEIESQDYQKDPRNYKVSFDKITSTLNFKITKSVSDGITEILEEIQKGRLNPRDTEFSKMSKLIENVKVF